MDWLYTIPGQPAYIWVWNQTSTTAASFHKYSIATGLEEAVYQFTLTGTSIGSAGGAEICVVNGQRLLLANYQNFALAGYQLPNGVVPVEFSSFSASANGSDVLLNWSTATENNNQGFEVLEKPLMVNSQQLDISVVMERHYLPVTIHLLTKMFLQDNIHIACVRSTSMEVMLSLQ